jgi:GNAT superfamily N-acetyltransferase
MKGFAMSRAVSTPAVSKTKRLVSSDACGVSGGTGRGKTNTGPGASPQPCPPVHRRSSKNRVSRKTVASPAAKSAARQTAAHGSAETTAAARRETAPGMVVAGRAGDHPDVYHLLAAVFHAPSREEFHASLEDPFYEPSDRLLVKRGSRLVAHVHLTQRAMQFAGQTLAASGVQWLATLPEFRSLGYGTRLLAAADAKMAADGSLLGLLRTRTPGYFSRRGWAVCGRHSYSRAKAREILARLPLPRPAASRPLSIRLWRHVELPALMRLYQQNTAGLVGPCQRSEAYWRWLIARHAFDQLLVAVDGPDKLDLQEARAPIVGYAVLRQERVVELVADPNHPSAALQLLARACAEAIERDRYDLVLEAPAASPLHRLVAAAGGLHHHHESDQGEVLMVKLLDPLEILRRLRPQLEARCAAAGLPRRFELGLLVAGRKLVLSRGRGGVRVGWGKLSRGYLACSAAELTRLALGHDSVAESAERGRLTASTASARQLAAALFPPLPYWRPLWDDLPV